MAFLIPSLPSWITSSSTPSPSSSTSIQLGPEKHTSSPIKTSSEDDDLDAPPQFPLPNSAQRSKPAIETPIATPTFELEVDEPEDRDDEDEDDGPPTPKPLNRSLPSTTAPSTSLPPPPSTTARPTPVPRKGRGKVALAPGCSPLDWAKLKTSGTDLRAVGPLSSELFTPSHSNPFGGGFMRVTPDELAKHNKKEDCWTVFNGKVYNVTAYLRFHPGGEGQMMRTAGRDGTKLFMLTHAWVNVDYMLDNCLVGFMVSG